MEKNIKILNETGIHARPAALLAKTAAQFSSDINIEFNGKTINAKSIMSILSTGLKNGDDIKIVTSGSDETEAMEAIIKLINAEFQE